MAGARPGERIVLYAKTGAWWLQPLTSEPFTDVQANSKWINTTHLGTDYAALLVEPGYAPPASTNELPIPEGMVRAVEIVKGQMTSTSIIVSFCGYEWRVRNAPSSRGGAQNFYDPANVWVDASGAMHLRTLKTPGKWTCAEVSLTRSLGFGTYLFSVRDISHLDPAATFGMFTWDYAGGDQNNREVDIEIGRWGDPNSKNAQFVIQPSYVPANVFRFSVPAGTITHSFTWETGRMSFKSVRVPGSTIARYDFTSGVPSPGLESVRMVLYVYRVGKVLPEKEDEVVVEKFEYLP
ncbi:MAG TPA: glycoside hydrolase family 16 protein [Bryobacteraceae bacterium]|nr:glycoside hydrolase family 16 protein [Bryobacteraceae bacterium]